MPVHYCAICNRSFSRSQHLVRHSRIHTGETPYKCLSCTESFKRSDMLKRHVLAAHLDDVPPKQPVVSTASSNKKKSSPLSSPADGEEDQKEVPWAESTREKREVGSDGSSWQNNTNDLNSQPPLQPPPSASTSFDPNRFYIPPPPPPPPPSMPNYNQVLHPYPYPPNNTGHPSFQTSYLPPASTFHPQSNYPLGPSPLLSGSHSPMAFGINSLSQYGFTAYHDGSNSGGGGPGPSSSSFNLTGSYNDVDPSTLPLGIQNPHLYNGMLSPNGRTGGNLDWSEMNNQRTWEGVDENWIAHALGTTDGLDWDGGMNYRLAEKLGIQNPSLLPPPPRPPAPPSPTTAFTNSTSAPSSIYPTQPALTPSPSTLSNGNSSNSFNSLYSTPAPASSTSTSHPAPSNDPIQSYANSLRTFNHSVLSTLPIPPAGLIPPEIELHYQSHPHLYVASHFGVPPPPNSLKNNFGVEGDNHHQYVEGRLPSPSNQPQLDPLNILPMTIFERRNLKKAMVELEIGLDGGKVGARKSGIRNETEGIAGVPMGRSFALETQGMFKARDRVTDLDIGTGGEGSGEGVRVLA